MTGDSDTPATIEAPSAAPRATVNRARWLFRALALLALLLVVLLAMVWWLATRPDGLQRALALADGMGGVQLVACGVSGPVDGPFQVERLAITHERVTVTVEHLRGELRLGALLYGTVGIQELTATRVVVEPHDSSKPTTDAGFLPAWLRLAWDRLQVDQLEIVGTGAPLMLRQLHTAGSLTRWTLRAQPLVAQWQDWTVRGKAELAAGQPMALQWQGQVNGPVLASGPNWLLESTFAGDLPTNAKTSRWQFTAKSMRPAGLSAQGDMVLGGGGWRVEKSTHSAALKRRWWPSSACTAAARPRNSRLIARNNPTMFTGCQRRLSTRTRWSGRKDKTAEGLGRESGGVNPRGPSEPSSGRRTSRARPAGR